MEEKLLVLDGGCQAEELAAMGTCCMGRPQAPTVASDVEDVKDAD